MKKGIKTLAMWLIIGVITIVLLSSIMENSNSKMTYSELVESIEAGEVEEIEISSDETTASVLLKTDKIRKEVNIPSIDSFMSYIEEPLKAGQFNTDWAISYGMHAEIDAIGNELKVSSNVKK